MTSTTAAPAGGALDRAIRRSSIPDRLAFVWVVGSLAWFVPLFRFDWFTPRFALLVAAMPVGLTCWYGLVRRRDHAAVVAAVFAAWMLVGALASANPRLSIGGATGRNYSILTIVGALSLWAIGRRLSASSVAMIGPAVLVAMVLNLLVGIYQVLVGIASGLYAGSPSRASGLLVNPVYLGSLMAGAAGFAAFAYVSRRQWWLLAGLGASGCGVMLSGSRVALATMLGLVAVALIRADRPRRGPLAVCAAAGLVVGWVVLQLGDGRSSVGRLSVGAEGRIDLWRLGVDAAGDRPLFGTGIGLFREGVQALFPVEFARDDTALGRQAWADPHNIGVLMLVSVGVVGVALLAVFAWLALRSARGPMLALFVGVALSWLLQPTPILTAPMAMLALGAAAPRLVDEQPTERSVSWRVPLGVGLVLASYVCIADLAFDRALRSDDEGAIEATSSLFVDDPNVEAIVASWYLGSGDDGLDGAIEHARLAAEHEHTRPIRWVQLGRLQLQAGDAESARVSLERAVELQPTELSAWLALIDVSAELDDERLADEASVRACELLPSC